MLPLRIRPAGRPTGARVLLPVALFLLAPSAAAAQRFPDLTPAQIETVRRNPDLLRQFLQRSGLTPEQVRNRLRGAGLPETLLDAYLTGQTGPPRTPFGTSEMQAIEALGLPFTMALEALPPDTGLVSRTGIRSRVFGVDAFRRTTTQFLPLLAGPVPSDYRLGPGDVLVLILSGDVESSHMLTVTRDGYVVIPQIGQVAVTNLTLEQLRDVLYTRLVRVYSGVRRGPGATTTFDVTVANVRVSQVYVSGEVGQPGAYQISALGTALTALYAAGGVTENANLRAVEVRRHGELLATLDLYDYLLTGTVRSDVRLESGDVVFVPVRGRRVSVSGAVVRRGIYEVTPGETLRDVVRAAGGFAAAADLSRLTVHRILPPAERGPGLAPRAAIDIELRAAGDSTPEAKSTRVVIPPLEVLDGDSLVIHELPDLVSGYFVAIAGAVRRPGLFPWRDGMTLRELVRLGGGPGVGADLRYAEIARMPGDRQAGQLADTVRVPMDSSYLELDASGRYAGPPGVTFAPGGSAPETLLLPYDEVLIPRQPEFEFQRTVTVMGEVLFPGTYALTRKDERLTDLVRRAGGLRSTAYPAGARFYRLFEFTGLGDAQRRRVQQRETQFQIALLPNMDQVNVSLPDALARPGEGADIVLQPGDSLFVPEYLPTVRVTGAVVAPASVQFVRGRSARYYIENAGGFTQDADEGRTVVRQANGSARTRSKFLFFTSWPEPGPGAEVFVPTKSPSVPGNWIPVLAAVASILASTASVVIALVR